MNNWIERNIIFPKINEIRMKEAKIKEELGLKASILKLLARKNNSVHAFQEPNNNSIRENYSIRKRKPSTIKRKKNIPQRYTLQQTNRETSLDSVQAEKHIIALELFQQRKSMFHPVPVKKISSRIPTTGRQQILIKVNQGSSQNIKALKNTLKKSKHKSKTDPIQQLIKQDSARIHQELDYFNIKKSPTYRFDVLQRIEEVQKSAKNQSKPKGKASEFFKQTSLKITSIKGWKFDEEQALQFL